MSYYQRLYIQALTILRTYLIPQRSKTLVSNRTFKISFCEPKSDPAFPLFSRATMVESHITRNVIILCDGTGKNGEVDKNIDPTNIWNLCKCFCLLLCPTTNLYADQVLEANKSDGDFIKYVPGVGASKGSRPSVGDILARTLGHTAGKYSRLVPDTETYSFPLVETVKSIYMTIAREYKQGDSVR